MEHVMKARMDDYGAIAALYENIIENTKNMERFARWKKGMHPTDAAIREYIAGGDMYMLRHGDTIASAMAVTMKQGEDYHTVSWDVEAADDEVAVLHVLGVSPDFQGKGIGKWMVDEAIRLAQTSGKKAVRLDALASNLPAQKMYQAKGFSYRGKQTLYADNTGWTEFFFYEYAL